MKQNINLYPLGIAFFLSSLALLAFRVSNHETEFFKGTVNTVKSIVSKEGFKINPNEPGYKAKYSNFHLKGVVYNSDDKIDQWVKQANDLKMPK